MDSDCKTALAARSDWGIKVRPVRARKGKPSPFSMGKQAKQLHDRRRPTQAAPKAQGTGMECASAGAGRVDKEPRCFLSSLLETGHVTTCKSGGFCPWATQSALFSVLLLCPGCLGIEPLSGEMVVWRRPPLFLGVEL